MELDSNETLCFFSYVSIFNLQIAQELGKNYTTCNFKFSAHFIQSYKKYLLYIMVPMVYARIVTIPAFSLVRGIDKTVIPV